MSRLPPRMRATTWLAAALLGCACAQPPAASQAPTLPDRCRAQSASYALVDDPAFSLHFEPATAWTATADSDLQLRLHTPRGDAVFALVVSNGYPVTRLLAGDGGDGDDGADDAPEPPALYLFGGAGHALTRPPLAGEPAPARLFAPALGPLLWYGDLAGRDGQPLPRQDLPAGMFTFSHCRT